MLESYLSPGQNDVFSFMEKIVDFGAGTAERGSSTSVPEPKAILSTCDLYPAPSSVLCFCDFLSLLDCISLPYWIIFIGNDTCLINRLIT